MNGSKLNGGAPKSMVEIEHLYKHFGPETAVSDVTLSSSRPQLPLAQRPYYRVLVRGEQLEPKSGRADDFTWPPS